MARVFDRYIRLEPRRPFGDLAKGLRAEIADSAWILGRQWRMGEHQGENASSPIQVDLRLRETVLKALDQRPGANLERTPPEALIEREADDWWTPGRRVLYGRRAAPRLPALDAADPDLLLADLPAPYGALNGRGYDGQAVHARLAELGLDPGLFADVPATPGPDLWAPGRFRYDARFTLEGGTPDLLLTDHRGGPLDWWSVDARAPLPPAPDDQLRDVTAVAGRLTFPGAPHPRLWMIEEDAVDIAGVAPDRSHFATLLLVEIIAGLGDNWFQVPAPSRPGLVLSIERAEVVDSFGDRWTLTPPTNWSLFGVDGLDGASVVLWPTAATPLDGAVLEDVVLGVDEDANFLIAVEQRVSGVDVSTEAASGLSPEGDPTAPGGVIDASKSERHLYHASSGLRERWHPYVADDSGARRRFIQARFANLSTPAADLLPEPLARLLTDPTAGAGDPPHAIDPSAVRETGLRLQRRRKLARDADARPLLWVERRQLGLLAPPVLNLSFDAAVRRLVVEPPQEP